MPHATEPLLAPPSRARYQAHRLMETELLDSVPACDAEDNLRDLARINRLFGGFRILRSQLRKVSSSLSGTRILDVAAGSTLTARWLQRALPDADVISTDLRQDLLGLGSGPRVAADALSLPFASGSVPIVISTLFLHHLPEEALGVALREMLRVSSQGVVAVDLLRHPLAFHFLRQSRPLFRWHPMTVGDGQRSVQAAFTAPEMRALLGREGLPQAQVRVHHPWFRLSVTIPKNGR
ncbi:MAG: methyltransferase domain-containing protein [Bryobacterales bacterium]|nr:methyltransferase domain-containing protein [Bryobacterales bacterium]